MKINGVKVKDASEPLTFTVMKADVTRGAAKKSSSCAAARALCREGHCEEARVHVSRAYIKKEGGWLRFGVAPTMRNEIIAFDRGGEFAPGTYTLAPVQPTVRLDAPSRKARGIPQRKTGKFPQRGRRTKRTYHVVSGVRAKMMADWE